MTAKAQAKERGLDPLSRALMMDVVHVAEQAAIACAALRGRGDEKTADRAAVDSMRQNLNSLDIAGRIVIGEGERDEAPMLYIGEEVGSGSGPQVDIAVDPLEGTTLCAKSLPGSLAVIAVSQRGTLLHAPDIYMDKIAIGPGFEKGLVDLDNSPKQNLANLADAKGCQISDLTALILDRPRHAKLIADVRAAGAGIKLITDGDIAGVIQTCSGDTGVDIYMGSGGAPEGVLAASALRCIGGQLQGRLVAFTAEEQARADKIGIKDMARKYNVEDMASGDVIFAATGVTDGPLLSGVAMKDGKIHTHTLVMRAASRTMRTIRATTYAPKLS